MAIGVTIVAAGLHVAYSFHAGGLWRDEAACVQLATVAGGGGLWTRLQHEAFPILFPSLIRTWCAIGLGTDLGLRALGCFIGMGLLAVLWWNARISGLRFPLVSLGLLATNVALIRWGDSMRAYGLGAILLLLTYGGVWNFVRQPDWKRFLWAVLERLPVFSVCRGWSEVEQCQAGDLRRKSMRPVPKPINARLEGSAAP